MQIKLYRYIILAAAIVIAIGCGSKKLTTPKIVIWHWMSDREQIFTELAQQYYQNTGIKIEFKLLALPDIYAQKVMAAARAGTLPDIYGILGEKSTFASFVRSGHVTDLTAAMEENDNEWRKTFYPQNIGVVSFNENNRYKVAKGTYAVPIDTAAIQFIYNKKLFLDAGLDPGKPPKTFDEMITYAKKIQKTDPQAYGFICGWGETWLIYAAAVEWAINIMGEDKFLQTIAGNVPYTDKDWIELFSLFSKLRGTGILAPNITSTINKEAEDIFAKNKVAFSFDGSWAVNIYKTLNPQLDYAFFGIPTVSSKYPPKIWGGAGSYFVINDKSPNKTKAIEFLRWLTKFDQQQYMTKNTNNLPAIKVNLTDLPPDLQPIANSLDNLTHPNTWPINEDTRVIEIINKNLQQLVMGIKTPQTAAEEIQEIKNRVMKQDEK